MNIALNQAAFSVAEARSAAGRTATAVAEATAARDLIAQRIAALEAERSEIASMRHGGNLDPSHGGRLALLALDLEGLQELLSQATAEVDKARAADQEAGHVVAFREAQLSQESERDALRRLIEHAGTLDGLLLATIREIGVRTNNLGLPRAVWAPTQPLAHELLRLDLNREHLGAVP